MKKTLKSLFTFLLVLCMSVGLMSVKSFAMELTETASGAGYSWDQDTKTLTLTDATLSEGFTLPDGSTIVVNGANTIAAGEANAITSEGALTVTGTGSLKLTGANGIKAASVAISDISVDFDTISCGIQIYNEKGSAKATLTGVNGKIVGDYAGIYVNGECAETEASVVITDSDLDIISEATSWNNRARKSGITVYVSTAEKVESSITINNSKVDAIGSDAGLSINNYLGDADATNSASSRINITDSTVVAKGTNGTWSGIFASVLGQHADADSIITITNSSVYALSPNTGILTSSQAGESKIILDNSILGASGKTALSMIEPESQTQVAELKNGSTYVQMTPAAVMKGEIAIFEGKTIVATAGDGITYDASNNYYVIPQGSAVQETTTGGTVMEYTFNNQAGGVGGFDYAKEEIWGFDKGSNNWAEGDIIITTPEELIQFATATQDGTLGNCEGRVVKLGNDIDMSGYDWYYRNAEGTIVTDHRIPDFNGTFDGQGYAIKNMTYRDEYAEATEMVPLAFIIQGKSTLKNLTIDGIKVDTVAPAYFAGMVKDYAWSGSNTSYVENCTVKNIEVDSSSDMAFGGMFYRLLDAKYITNCHVKDITVNVGGNLVGDNSGRNGGFIGTGGEKTPISDCSVSDLIVNVKGTGGHLGGFIGGASMTVSFDNCDVNGFELNAEAKFSAVGGFMGYTAGSAWGSGMIIKKCDVTELDIKSTARISTAGGFIGYTYGEGKALDDGAHNFTDCTASGSITTGENSKAGGFIGWLYGRSGNGCSANFVNCDAAVNVYSGNYGGGFAGYYVPYNNFIMRTSYTNCTASGDVFAAEPVGSFLDADAATVDGIIGGTYNYDPENVNSETGETNNVAPGYRALDNGDGTWTVFPDKGLEVVKIAFHRWNDETDAYENFRTVEVFKDAKFLDYTHNNEINYSHPIYRFKNGNDDGIADGLDEINKDAGSEERPFTYWTDAPDGIGEEVLVNSTVITADMNVYVAVEEVGPERTLEITKVTEIGEGTTKLTYPLQGIEFEIYYAGTVDEYTEYVEAYVAANGSADEKAIQEAFAAEKANSVLENDILEILKTDISGKAIYKVKEDGIYLVIEREHPAIVKPLAPFVVAVPMTTTTEEGTEVVYNVLITPKNEVVPGPEVNKNVTAIDTEIDSFAVGDVITWILRGEIPADIANGKSYVMTDVLDDWLDYADNVKVVVANGEEETELSAEDYEYTFDSNTKTFEFELTKAGMKTVADAEETAKAELEIRVYLDTTLNKKASVGDKVPNIVKLQYTNSVNFYYEDVDDAAAYTCGISIYKYDAKNKTTALAGAKFILAKAVSEDTEGAVTLVISKKDVAYVIYEDFYTFVDGNGELAGPSREIVTDANGQAKIYGLDEGKYYLVETQAPEGYNLLSYPVEINVLQHSDEAPIEVANSNQFKLPATGGVGTTIFTVSGACLMAAAAVMLVMKKRKEEMI